MPATTAQVSSFNPPAPPARGSGPIPPPPPGEGSGGARGDAPSRGRPPPDRGPLHLPAKGARSRGGGGGAGNARGGAGAPAEPAHVSGRPAAPAAPWPPPPPPPAPSLRRLAFHLRIFHAGLAWRRAVCGPHKGRRVLHSSRWGRAGRGPRPGGAPACEAEGGAAWPARCRRGPLPGRAREFHLRKHALENTRRDNRPAARGPRERCGESPAAARPQTPQQTPGGEASPKPGPAWRQKTTPGELR